MKNHSNSLTNSPREKRPFYIGMDQSQKQKSLDFLGIKSLDELFNHIPKESFFKKEHSQIPFLKYEDLFSHMETLSKKNIKTTSFIGDGLTHNLESEITSEICSLRGLTTAYTPYQPERSQGTLQTLWIYQSLLSELTGFEAINASLYDRSSCLYEALNTAIRISPTTNNNIKCAWVSHGIYPQDKNVLTTMAKHTDLNLNFIPMDSTTGTLSLHKLEELYQNANTKPQVFAFPQVNALGNLEDVDAITDFCTKHQILSIAIIDPMLLGNECLKPPVEFGTNKQGVDLFVAEGQHIAFAPMYGGPGLGIFGIRYNEKNKNNIRQTPGRYIGKAKDLKGNDCKVIVLSTREQHIRREKATSNICSNQSFIATVTGAALLNMGSDAFSAKSRQVRGACLKTLEEILRLKGVELAFPNTPFWNEVTLKISPLIALKDLITKAKTEKLEIGIDVSDRIIQNNNTAQLLKISFGLHLQDADLKKLIHFFQKNFENQKTFPMISPIKETYFRQKTFYWKSYTKSEVVNYYKELEQQNISPDEGIYPLGSCTMKYNPYVNDWAAGLENFTQIHPQTDDEFAQGNLEILYETQEFFKNITGLAAVTTQPLAGAQGELVGLKLFQAYHSYKNEERNILLIPKSAHGTNPATASYAGYGEGIVLVDADEFGLINLEHVKTLCQTHGKKIAGIMITNPNTSGLYEKNFRQVADLIHQVDGLVYMDGANMNAIAGWINLNAIGVDAVHNNLHKTWTIPHGGGGPGDAIVAVSEKLVDYLPGIQVRKNSNGQFESFKTSKSIGDFHRHFGNFNHKVRCYTYIKALGTLGSKEMSAVAVLSARYLYKKLSAYFPILPSSMHEPRMHEFIITLPQETFAKCEKIGLTKPIAITRVGKLFLDFGFHAPTVAFPEPLGLMIEPTESFTLDELDHFAEVVIQIGKLIEEKPEILLTVPHFTPIDRVDEVSANKNLQLSDRPDQLISPVLKNKIDPKEIKNLSFSVVKEKLYSFHQSKIN